uniref:FAM69 protein-kinase domain-containing protein n=1 Tax=Panagrolaimus sp. JU765 TaxID=591449 RepID=A0AC34QJR5_9BILA
MDADMLYTETKLQKMLTSKKCVTDNDCTFYDCESRCDIKTGHCSPRLNDNIDVFCKKLINKIFTTIWSKNNRYLAACHEPAPVNATKRLNDLRLVWAWNLADI